jgi:hypothetical protein
MRSALAISASALVLGGWTPASHAAVPQPVRFWPNVSLVVAGPGAQRVPLVTRPKTILLTNDGFSGVARLRWTGWGTTVAHATGVIVGRRVGSNHEIRHPARVRLSDPGRFHGHEVYRCLTVTVAKHVDLGVNLCLAHRGGVWTFGPPVEKEFLAASMQGGCSMSPTLVTCMSYATPAQVVTLDPDGGVAICAGTAAACHEGNFGEDAPQYDTGQSLTDGPFRCEVLATGVRCTVLASGKGFVISPTTAVRLVIASARRP